MMPSLARTAGNARRALAAHLRGHEDGVTMAIFAIAIVVLLGMVALGIDGSRIYDERRRAQNAADHAAIAAAYESCTTSSSDVVAAAVAAGLNSAEQNGYDNNGTSNSVDINVTGGTGSHQYEAIVDTTIQATFGAVMGFGDMPTTARAEAEATGCDASGGGVPAMYGGGNCAGYEKDIDFSGERNTVNGLTHTNGDFYQSSNNNAFLNAGGPSVTYIGAFEGKKGNNNTYAGPEKKLGPAPEPWPTGFDPVVNMTNAMWEAYKNSPNRVNTSSSTMVKLNVTANGIYYTESTSELVVEAIPNGAQFTIVSKFSPVKFAVAEDGKTFHAYPNNPAGTPANTIVVSGYDPSAADKCSKMGFMRSGNKGTWNGNFWAPRANIEWSGNEVTVNGGVIGFALKVNGNDHVFNGGTGLSEQSPDVFLLQ